MSKGIKTNFFLMDEYVARKYSYKSKKNIKMIFRGYHHLQALAQRGIPVAICIKSDLDWALNYYGYYDGLYYPELSSEYHYIANNHLIMGETQSEISKTLGISQSTISNRSKYLLSKVWLILYDEEEDIDPKEYEYVERYYKDSTKSLPFKSSRVIKHK